MSELNKKLSALSRQQGVQKGMAYSDIKPANIKPVNQASLKPWAALGVLGLGAVIGIGGWKLWQADEPKSLRWSRPSARWRTAEAASVPLASAPKVTSESQLQSQRLNTGRLSRS